MFRFVILHHLRRVNRPLDYHAVQYMSQLTVCMLQHLYSQLAVALQLLVSCYSSDVYLHHAILLLWWVFAVLWAGI
jgi:hypothetical protein